GLWEEMQRERLPGLDADDGYVMNLFPDGFLMVRANFVSIDVQHLSGPTQLLYEQRQLGVRGESADVTARRSAAQRAFLWDAVGKETFRSSSPSRRACPRAAFGRASSHAVSTRRPVCAATTIACGISGVSGAR